MDYKRARKQLKKIKTLLDSFESLEEPISEMEAKLLRKYADNFKDIIPHGEEIVVDPPKTKSIPKPSKPVFHEAPKAEVEPTKTAIKIVKPKAESEEYDVAPIVEELEAVEKQEVVEKPKPKKVEKVEAKEAKKPVAKKAEAPKAVKKPRKSLVASSDEEDDTVGNLWEPVAITELSQKLSFSPIKNIHKAISINERIFTQNELFAGDHILFRSTLEQIEGMSSFEEASTFLKNGIAKDENWESGKKRKKAIQFMHLVQRRFL